MYSMMGCFIYNSFIIISPLDNKNKIQKNPPFSNGRIIVH